MIFKCPDCQSALEAPADVLGKRVQCTHCESKFILEDTPKTAKKKILVTPRPRQSKKRPPKAATNKLLLPGLLLTIIALAVFFFQTRKTSLDHPQLAEKLSTSVSASTAPAATKLIGQKNLFKFAAWSKKYGRTVDINDWMKRNPHPYGQRFDPNRSYFQHRYTTTLGPLGIRTLMHEQSWSRRYLPLLAKFPEFLKDSHGPLWNAFEVVHVQENGPAHTHVQKGDFIVAIEDEVVKSAEWTNLENKFSATKNRGMEIHAGQMIDQAEGRGKIKVKVLRLPKDYKNTPIAARTAELIKEQNFDAGQSAQVALPVEAQYFSIKSADKSHLTLSHMFLVNEQGVKIPLDTLERGKLFKHSAFSQRFINPKTQTWTIQSPFHCDFIIPPGKWKLVGEVHNKSKHSIAISFSQIPRAKFPAALERYCKTLEFKIPRIGSFGKNFDPHCNKVRNYSAILAKRLAIQQAPDGSWPFINSYTTPAFYTSMCGLGLLAEDNPAYQKHIRKAAHYVAYSGQFSAWSWARGINAMFLGEYYLRTKDKSILTGLSLALKRCEDTLLVGYVAGHHFHNPGYSGGGQISGSGTIACALAIAEHTPAKFTRGTALKMMERIQSLAIHGTVPYGRASARSSKRKVFDLNNRWPGQSSTAGVAPYYMAAKISGGSSYFNEIVSRRFRQAPYGDVDGGHGTHTIPYTLGSIAISLCSPEAHKANMQAFLWKLTTQRGFDGFIVNNSNPMEHHTGETVMGKPWWSTGAYLIMMNAHKRNLAITGEKQYMAESQKDLPLILDVDMKVYRHVLRQWCTVEAALGQKTPTEISTAIQELAQLKKEANYGMKVIEFLQKNSLKCAKSISKLQLKDKQFKNYCLEIILGVDHDIFLDQHNWRMKEADRQNLAKKAKAQGREKEYDLQARSVTVTINSKTYFSTCNTVLPMTSNSDNPLPEFVSQGKLRIVDKNGRAVKGLPKTIILDNSKLEHKFTLPIKKGVDKLYAQFSYRCAGFKISYTRELLINRHNDYVAHNANLRSLWIPGTLKRDFNGWVVDILLENGVTYNGTTQSDRPRLSDFKGKPLKEFILRWGSQKAYFPLHLALSKANQAKFLVSAGSRFEGRVHEMRVKDPLHNTIKNISYTLKKGSLRSTNGFAPISDNDPDTTTRITTDDEGKFVLEFSCAKTSISKFYCMIIGSGSKNYTLEYFDKGSWTEFAWGNVSRLQGFRYNSPCPASTRFRMSIQTEKPLKFDIVELHFFK